MPFDEEEEVLEKPKVELKKVSTKKSMFDDLNKKPSKEDFEKKVKYMNDKSIKYKTQAAELVKEFNKCLADKTLAHNKSVFVKEIENELLFKMIKLAEDINNDPDEKEGTGSLSWITILLKNSFAQRDKINYLEYSLSEIEKKISPEYLLKIFSGLDKKNTSG